jgi:hypothetical protein
MRRHADAVSLTPAALHKTVMKSWHFNGGWIDRLCFTASIQMLWREIFARGAGIM